VTIGAGKPTAFIGSSSEGLDVARVIRGKLEKDVELTMWDDDFFKTAARSLKRW
jgi:hypothetical protein